MIELCFNLWYCLDREQNIVAISAKAYMLDGTEDEKAALLKQYFTDSALPPARGEGLHAFGHIVSLGEMGEEHAGILGRVVKVAGELAASEGIAQSGYRFITNVGPDSGQAVFHLHFHLLGGRPLGGMVRRAS